MKSKKFQLIIALSKKSKVLILEEIENKLDESTIKNIQSILKDKKVYLKQIKQEGYKISYKKNKLDNEKVLSKKEIKY